MPLTESDYDVLFDELKDAMPRIGRSEFPRVLEHLVKLGIITVALTGKDVQVGVGGTADVYRVARRLH